MPLWLVAQQRADQLPEVESPTDTDIAVTVRGGGFFKTTFANLKTYFNAGSLDSVAVSNDTLFAYTARDTLFVSLTDYAKKVNIPTATSDLTNDSGFLTAEVDGSTTNEIQDISTNDTPGNITLSDGSTLTLNVEDDDADATNEIQAISIDSSGTSFTITLSESGGSVTFEAGSDGVASSIFRENLQALKDSSEYTPGGEVFLTESEARYNVKYALGELETEDNYFSVKLNEPSSAAENLISWSENLEKGEGLAPTPGQWEYYGSGVDLSILPDAVDGPIGNGDKADGVVRNGGSNTFRARLTDTIFAGEQYYLSFWFRAGTNTPTSGVSLRNYTFFNHRTNATATTLQTTALNTSDTTWRLYQFPLSISPTDLDSVSLQAQFFGTNVFDTIYTTRWSITRESDYSYYKTTKNSIKKGVLWATIETDKGVLNFNALPDEIVGQVKNPGRRFQYAHDYCFETKNCNVIYIEPEGLTVTDTTIILKDNIGIESTFLGDVNENRLKATITFDLNNPNLNGFFVIPDTVNTKVEPVGSGLKNLNINVVSPMKTVLDMGNTLASSVDNVTMHLDSFALHGIRMGGEEWPGYDGELSPLGNNVFRTRIFNATDAAILVEGGTLNYIDQSQMHRSGKGVTVRDNATVTLLNSWIEKAEGLAIDVESAAKFTYQGGYFEGQNRYARDTVGMRFHNVKVLTFEDNTVSNAGIEVDAYIELDSVEQFNVVGNRYAGPNGMEVLDYTPGITCTNRYGNSYFAVGFTPPAPTFCDVSLVNPTVKSGSLDTAFISSAEYRDTSVLANFVLVGKTNYIAHSEAIDNANSTYSINPGRITVTQNDATNPIDGALNAERLTLTADLSAKLVTITPAGISFTPGEEYNLSFWLEPGSEAFNDNLTITFEADKNVIIESGFDATVKDWQLVEVVVRPTVVDTEVAIQLNGDASDYCWISGAQITKGRYRADYAKTTGTVGAATPKITGDLIIDGDITVTGTTNWRPEQYTATEASALTPSNGDLIYVTSTDATFTSVGFWGYENGSWSKL